MKVQIFNLENGDHLTFTIPFNIDICTDDKRKLTVSINELGELSIQAPSEANVSSREGNFYARFK